MWFSVVQCGLVWVSVVQFGAVWCSLVWVGEVCTLIGLDWFGLVWFDLVWFYRFDRSARFVLFDFALFVV